MGKRGSPVHLLRTLQRVETDRETVFGYFSQPENLAELTPDWLRFRILTPSPASMREGALIDYRIGLGPVPTRWRTMITSFDPPYAFVDEQLLGPYSFWHHTHRFEEAADGTLLIDEIRYVLPYGLLGEVVHALAIRRQLARIFGYRHRRIAEKFGDRPDPRSGLEFLRV